MRTPHSFLFFFKKKSLPIIPGVRSKEYFVLSEINHLYVSVQYWEKEILSLRRRRRRRRLLTCVYFNNKPDRHLHSIFSMKYLKYFHRVQTSQSNEFDNTSINIILAVVWYCCTGFWLDYKQKFFFYYTIPIDEFIPMSQLISINRRIQCEFFLETFIVSDFSFYSIDNQCVKKNNIHCKWNETNKIALMNYKFD